MMSKWAEWYPILGVVVIVICGLILIPMVIAPAEEGARLIEPDFKTEVCARLNKADPERKIAANIEYHVSQGWREGSPVVKFFSTLEGELYEVRAYDSATDHDPEVYGPNTASWPRWQEAFAQARQEAETGLATGAKEILQKREEEEKKVQ